MDSLPRVSVLLMDRVSVLLSFCGALPYALPALIIRHMEMETNKSQLRTVDDVLQKPSDIRAPGAIKASITVSGGETLLQIDF